MQAIVTQVTQGIKITVKAVYEPLHSRPYQSYFVFSYNIAIENKSDVTIKLLRRHWHIFDTLAGWHEVEGEGVISMQPVMHPSEEYQYESFCPLMSEAGKMHGTYLMENKKDGSTFLVNIPLFELIVPYRSN
ncbi:MAG TPA: Co2+/Mg2+ efflux protein ApaG [Bacteroidia bacterium]|jgi:ApaG protein|nr:Co2+/Mg2+ efflux protein ApaG [Bacteroidia bacterium]